MKIHKLILPNKVQIIYYNDEDLDSDKSFENTIALVISPKNVYFARVSNLNSKTNLQTFTLDS